MPAPLPTELLLQLPLGEVKRALRPVHEDELRRLQRQGLSRQLGSDGAGSTRDEDTAPLEEVGHARGVPVSRWPAQEVLEPQYARRHVAVILHEIGCRTDRTDLEPGLERSLRITPAPPSHQRAGPSGPVTAA